jgi:putative tryptophan/tyrosine transport system substrate-binding protein
VVTRRAFLGTLAGSLLGAPLAGEAQQAGKVYKIGLVFNILPPTFPEKWAFYERMMELGWVYGRDFLGEYRVYGDQYDRVPHMAAELIRAGVDIFVVQGGLEAARVQQVTRTIPIVTTTAGDLVTMGLAVSLARPGGNVTGIMQPGLFPKHLSLLKEAIPRLSRLGVLSHGPTPTLSREAEAAGKTLRIALQAVAVQNIDEFDAAFSAFHADGAQGLVILRDSFIGINIKKLMDLALRY